MKTPSNRSFLCLLIAALCGLWFCPQAQAQWANATPTPKPLPPASRIAEDTIQSVTANSITISHIHERRQFVGGKLQISKDPVTKTYAITASTEIAVNGNMATVNDLAPGMSVSITADAADDDSSSGGTATSINAHAAPSK